MPDTKVCPNCGEQKPLSGFWKNRSTRDGFQSRCKPCHHLSVEAALKGPDREKYLRMRRNGHLKRKYGITIDEYDAMAEASQGCWVCHHQPAQGERGLAVDHDHACCPGERSCGKCVRGLLCQRCNQGIGQFREDPELLRWAAHYIERSAMRPS